MINNDRIMNNIVKKWSYVCVLKLMKERLLNKSIVSEEKKVIIKFWKSKSNN